MFLPLFTHIHNLDSFTAASLNHLGHRTLTPSCLSLGRLLSSLSLKFRPTLGYAMDAGSDIAVTSPAICGARDMSRIPDMQCPSLAEAIRTISRFEKREHAAVR